jgi:hypothetical protein
MNSKLKYLLSFVIILCIPIITQAESKIWTFCDSVDTGKEIIDIKCKLKGEVSLILYDLLGNLVFEEQVNKNSNILSIPIKQDIISGTYFIRIDIDGKFLYSDKIMIIK